ncbi:MAG TPA: discoidin domain-containing protein, partial [Candidatus Acidoferrales bacterium]|nr:discoidin domain-containing protein [Candidatus Acidoferrales bacterium]
MKISTVKKMLLTLGVAGLICAAGNLQAAEIQGVTISSFSGQNYSYPSTATYSVTNLVSSTGLFGDYHCWSTGGCMWLSTNGLNATNFVTFNLGGPYTLNAVKVWNYNDPSHLNYGVSSGSISYSVDGVNFTTAIASTNFIEGLGGFETIPQMIGLPSAVTAQYVRINVNTNFGGGTAGVGLSKVRFISNTNLPTVLNASENFGSNQVTVIFSESVDPVSAMNAANYSISGSSTPTINSVSMGEYADRVILHTSPLTGSYSVSVSGVYDEALTAAVANNSSVPVQPELYLWLRADQGVTTTSAFGGNMLTAWNDQSSYGHNAQAASFFGVLTNQPFLTPNVVNGLPAVQFFGTNVMQIPNDAANPINGDMTIFTVVSIPSSGSIEDPISKTGGGSNSTTTNNLAAPFDFYFDGTTAGGNAGHPIFYFGDKGVVGNKLTGNGQLAANTFYIVAASVTGTNLTQIIVNGNSPISCLNVTPTNGCIGTVNIMNSAPQDAGNPITLGARNSGGSTLVNAQPFIGYLPEVMLIRGTITPADFASIENYLTTKYAIAPPSISEQPASLAAKTGSQATFWAGAVGGMPISYQWQSNGLAITGATNLFYTTPPLTSSANGAVYQVTISNAAGTVNSSNATLTVAGPSTPPTVYSAIRSPGLTNVTVVFSESIDLVTGL